MSQIKLPTPGTIQNPTPPAKAGSPWRAAWHLAVADAGAAMLRCLPAEVAHELGIWMLESGLADWLPRPNFGSLLSGMRMDVPGVGQLVHPIGLAAGFDKHGRCPHALRKLGFSFIELGTVTPQPQPGNPRPRLFREPEIRGLINRMGFNSDGASAVAARLKRYRWNHDGVPLGVNVGKNKQTAAAAARDDYLRGIEAFAGLGRYLVMNLSSPNTPGLRDLATREFIEEMGQELSGRTSQVWIKLDPDQDRQNFQDVIEAVASSKFAGVILTNTHRVVAPEVGGLSGAPIASMACTRLEWAWQVHKGALPMIASGGIMSGVDVMERLIRGACAVQVYTAFIYRGPWVVLKMLRELADEMKLRGFACAEDAVGTFYG